MTTITLPKEHYQAYREDDGTIVAERAVVARGFGSGISFSLRTNDPVGVELFILNEQLAELGYVKFDKGEDEEFLSVEDLIDSIFSEEDCSCCVPDLEPDIELEEADLEFVVFPEDAPKFISCSALDTMIGPKEAQAHLDIDKANGFDSKCCSIFHTSCEAWEPISDWDGWVTSEYVDRTASR